MTEENVEKIRKDAIEYIKEKTKKNPEYLHPMNKERQEDMKRLKFTNGNDFTYWMQQNGVMKNPADIERKEMEKTIKNAGCKNRQEYNNKCAKDAGFKDSAERLKEWTHDTGRYLPKEFNEDCSAHFGDFTESLMIQTFEDSIKMPYGNPGFDWMCKEGDKIDNKGACLTYGPGSPRCVFHINSNNIADWFVLSAWDSRDSLTPLYVLVFHKKDIVRGRKFCEFKGFSVTYTPECLKELERWEITDRLDKLKELIEKENKRIEIKFNK